ncbi:hypothetical protein [Teichococcus vastitatis]|uniref:Lamin tail domain-containing protein n=1 Tax=Teichococcus vastitatis TaxID=2307076 RepID=A0ABS9W023_9PROT|nr:hypothetical protein [Pseudoroseomonas vastitatis]MCI0752516.1 hypothetical protein [Pseudoroseomonas vastitatis]
MVALLVAPWPGAGGGPGGALAQTGRPAPSRAPAAAAERELLISNELGLGLRELYVTPAGSVEPGRDRLGEETLPTGATLRLPLGRTRLCLFDLRAVLADGSVEERRGLDTCRAPRVLLGDPDAPMRMAVVVNDTDIAIRELYAAPSGASDRGADRLGSETVDAEASFELRLGRTRACQFDIIAVFEDDTTQERRRIDLCRRTRVAFGDPSIPWRQAEIANGAGRGIRNLYAATAGTAERLAAAQPDAPDWGTDRLGNTTLEPGDRFRLRLRSRDCRIDLRAVYEDDGAEEKRSVDLCAATQVLFDGSGVPQPPERSFILVNRHAATVQQVFASGIDNSDWGEDRLPDGPLERGTRAEVMLRSACELDLRVLFANGGAEERRGINICNNGLIVLRPGWTLAERLDQGAGVADRGPPREGSVRLRNAGAAPLVELYVDATGAPRGPDRLGSTVLGRGETLDFQPPLGVGCTAHLRAVFRDGQELERPGFDLCSGTEVSLPEVAAPGAAVQP